jgi:hypothetical protein
MKITLENTTKIVKLVTEGGSGEVPARIWEGTTDSGIPVHCFVTRIAVAKDADAAQFERELLAQRPPSPAVAAAYPLRMIL